MALVTAAAPAESDAMTPSVRPSVSVQVCTRLSPKSRTQTYTLLQRGTVCEYARACTTLANSGSTEGAAATAKDEDAADAR